MHLTLGSSFLTATIAVTLLATATDASAQRGWGWGPGLAIGAITGAVVAGAIIASRPPGYVVYPGYAQPVYAAGCYWASQPVYDGAGRIVGYTGRPVQDIVQVMPDLVEPCIAVRAGPLRAALVDREAGPDACFIVRDHSGQALACVYLERRARPAQSGQSCSRATKPGASPPTSPS